MARVAIDNVSKNFTGPKRQSVHAVRDVSLTVADKEFVVLVGPSGCGKSTLLRLIAGLEDLDAGAIAIDGQVVNGVDPKDRDVAMVFQNYALYPHMTVRENLEFGLKLRKFPKPEIGQRVGEVAEMLGLTPLLDRLPKALSGGQRQRVAVGRAIVRRPKVFLFDEPLSNLDAQMRVQMRTEIARLHRRLQATMIYVTHDQTEAMMLCDRVVVMKDGAIQQVADPHTLYRRPANRFVAGFISSPAMNFFRGTLAQRNGSVWFVEDSAATGVAVPLSAEHGAMLEAWTGKSITLGLRPEHITSSRGSAKSSEDGSVAATLEVVEPMGAETYWYLTTGAHSFVARVTPEETATLNQSMTVNFRMSEAHFFDPATEARLGGLTK